MAPCNVRRSEPGRGLQSEMAMAASPVFGRELPSPPSASLAGAAGRLPLFAAPQRTARSGTPALSMSSRRGTAADRRGPSAVGGMSRRVRSLRFTALAALAVVAAAPSATGCARSVTVGGGANDAGAPAAPRDAAPARDGGAPPLPCDDGDPCTVGRAGPRGCVFEPAPDGTACDDGDPCTYGDRCEAGTCRATADAPRVLAIHRPALRGSGTSVGGGRFLYASPRDGGAELLLVRVAASGFDEVARATVPEAVRSIESLGPDLVALHFAAGGQLVRLDGDALSLLGRFEVAGRTLEVALAGDRLFVCVALDWLSTELVELDAAELGDLRRVGVPTTSCRSVVAGSTGAHAFVTDPREGLRRLTPRPRAVAAVEDFGPPGDALHAAGGILTSTTARQVRLLRESDGAPLASRVLAPARIRSARTTARGVEVFVQGADTLDLVVHDRVGDGLVERARESLGAVGAVSGAAATWVSSDEGFRLGEAGRVFFLNASPPYLREVVDPDLAWPAGLRVEGDRVLLRDATRAVALDASDPRRLVSTASGLHGGASDRVTLERTDEGALLVADAARRVRPQLVEDERPPIGPWLPGATVALRSFGPGQTATDRTVVDLGFSSRPGQRDTLYVGGPFLYHLSRPFEAPAALRLTRHRLEDLGASPSPTPDATRTLTLSAGETLVAWAYRHDEGSTAFAAARPDGAHVVRVLPLSFEAAPVGAFALDFEAVDLAVRGGRVVVLGVEVDAGAAERVHVVGLERRGGDLHAVGRRSWPTPRPAFPEGRQILAFDGERIHLEVGEGVEGAEEGAVLALAFDRLDGTIGTYPIGLGQLAGGFAIAPFGLVLSYRDAVVVAEPWCPD